MAAKDVYYYMILLYLQRGSMRTGMVGTAYVELQAIIPAVLPFGILRVGVGGSYRRSS